MKKLAGESLNIKEENLAAMQQLFPEAFEEGKIDFDVLRQLLGDYVDDEEERYSFRWNGKGKALRLSQTPSTGTLRPCKEESKDWDTTENLYIEGDNLEVLKLLQKSYHGRVKMIYIDPPYNTGKDFVYKDDFRDNVANYKRITGQVDDEGRSTGTNSESNGRFHTDWLNMMYPRLRLARNLLSDDGVIFISIDDNEQGNLRHVCDEIFGEMNFVAELVWERAFSPKNDAKYVSNNHDYVLMYARDIAVFQIGRLPRTEEANARYQNPDNDPRGIWMSSDISVKTYTAENDYPIIAPSGRIIKPPAGRCWRLSKNKFLESLQDNRIWFGENGDGVPRIKRFLSELKYDGMAPTSILFYKDVGHNQEGAKEVTQLFEAGVFDGPKPVRLLKWLLTLANLKKDSIVLDFFSGSASTAHALVALNAENGWWRRFIMVQVPEFCDVSGTAHKAGYENICEIGKERIRRAGEKVKAECEDAERAASLDIGFKVFKLDSSNLQKWQPQPEDLLASLQESMDNFLPDRTNLDVVYEIALKLGLDLSYEVEEREADGQTIYIIGAGALMICLASPISMETAEALLKLHEEYEPETWQVVFRDTGFLSDQEKTNIKETLKGAGLDEDAFISI